MQLGGLIGLGWLLLAFLAVVVIVVLVTAIGAVIVAAVCLPLLYLLPAVRRAVVSATESVTGSAVDGPTDLRVVAVYAVVVDGVGVAALLALGAAAEASGTLPVTAAQVAAGSAALAVLLALAVGGTARLAGASYRTLVEWTVFVVAVVLLTLVAAVVVPVSLFRLVFGPG